MRIVLIGMMGAGKSKLGKKLARDLGYTFIDSDEEITHSEGMSINDIFQSKGEAYFRQCEQFFLENLDYKHVVLSVGGGFPCFEGRMDALNAYGTTIYLKHSPEFLYSRLIDNRKERPLIRDMEGDELKQYLRELLVEREPYYLQANYCLDRPLQTVQHIIDLLHLQKR